MNLFMKRGRGKPRAVVPEDVKLIPKARGTTALPAPNARGCPSKGTQGSSLWQVRCLRHGDPASSYSLRAG